MIDEFRCAKHTTLNYADWDLYDEWNVSTLLVNQVDQQLHFGDDRENTTNHNIRKFFFPEEETSLFGLVKNKKQSYKKWNEKIDGIYDANDVLQDRWIKRFDLETSDPRDEPKEEWGSVFYSPLPESCRKKTFVYGVAHIVAPDNAKGTTTYRNRCRRCVVGMVKKCIELALKLNVSRLVLPEICCDHLAEYDGRLDKRYAACMRGAVIECVRTFMKEQKRRVRKLRAIEYEKDSIHRNFKKPLRICLSGKSWDDSI